MNQDDIGATIRAICQAIGGVLIAKGAMSDSDVALYSGAAVSIATLLWSLWQKHQARLAKAAAVAAASVSNG